MTRLLESLLTLARADQSAAALPKTKVDAAAIAREAGELMRGIMEENEQRLVIEADQPLMVEAEPNILRQAVVNLLDNAAKHTPAGTTIRVRALLTPTDEIAVEVSDTGPGIAPEHQDRVFDRFYRVDKARSRETGGVGLGLALAKSAVEMNGGRIELESEPGKGSTFRIVLTGFIALQGNSGAAIWPPPFRQGEKT